MNPKRHFEPIATYQTPAQKAAIKCVCEINTAGVELIEALKDSYRNEIDTGCLLARLKHTRDNDYVAISNAENNEELVLYRYDGRGVTFTSGFRFSANRRIEMMRTLTTANTHLSFPKQPSAPKPK